MNTTAIAAIIVAIIAIAILAWLLVREKRRKALRSRFGPEYDRVVQNIGNRDNAEAELARREKRVKKFTIRELSTEERERYIQAWLRQQSQFIDEPAKAVSEADALVTSVMTTRGYPMTDFETQAADISVDHPRVVGNYREAHQIARQSESGQATTEDLRRAMVCYRALFEELVGKRVVTSRYEEVHKEEVHK
jgi:hypothetical protein